VLGCRLRAACLGSAQCARRGGAERTADPVVGQLLVGVDEVGRRGRHGPRRVTAAAASSSAAVRSPSAVDSAPRLVGRVRLKNARLVSTYTLPVAGLRLAWAPVAGRSESWAPVVATSYNWGARWSDTSRYTVPLAPDSVLTRYAQLWNGPWLLGVATAFLPPASRATVTGSRSLHASAGTPIGVPVGAAL